MRRARRSPPRRHVTGPRGRAVLRRTAERRRARSRSHARERAAARQRCRPSAAGLSDTTPSTRPAARWQSVMRERAHHAQAVGDARRSARRSSETYAERRRLERQDLELVLRPLGQRPRRREMHRRRASPSTPRPCRSRGRSRRTTSSIVSPSATAIEMEKNGMPRFAFSEPSIGSTTTVQRPFPSTPDSSLTSRTSRPRKRARITASAAASIAVVSSPP